MSDLHTLLERVEPGLRDELKRAMRRQGLDVDTPEGWRVEDWARAAMEATEAMRRMAVELGRQVGHGWRRRPPTMPDEVAMRCSVEVHRPDRFGMTGFGMGATALVEVHLQARQVMSDPDGRRPERLVREAARITVEALGDPPTAWHDWAPWHPEDL